jgi:hypothetical protein
MPSLFLSLHSPEIAGPPPMIPMRSLQRRRQEAYMSIVLEVSHYFD